MKKGTISAPKPTILTIGHSNRSLDEFVRMLHAHGVELLVDVRTIPRSRHNPHFNGDALPKSMRAAQIGYRHIKALGGLRHARKDSINTAWRNSSFRGFADHMQTEEFISALEGLIELSRTKSLAIMCAEAVPWRCHRSLIADALTTRGVSVEHIFSETQRKPHSLAPFLKVRKGVLTYPAEKLQHSFDFIARDAHPAAAAPRSSRSNVRPQRGPRSPAR